MSIRRYLFLLITGLILLLSASQLFLAWFFKGQLQQEVQADSKALSRELVSVVIDSVSDVAESPEFPFSEQSLELIQEFEALSEEYGELTEALTLIKQHPEGEFNVIVYPPDEPQSHQEFTEHQEHMAQMAEAQRKLEGATREAREQQMIKLKAREREIIALQEAWAEQVQKDTAERYRDMADRVLSRLDKENLSSGRVEFLSSPGVVHEVNVRGEHTQDLLAQYMEWMLALIAITGVLAIALASLVISWVSRPLSELAQGHRQLGEGQLGVQVKEQGVSELRRMLAGFNRMSLKLAELSKKEQQMAGQQHLAELGQITRGIAHSLRNPLQTLGMLSESVEPSPTQEQRSRLADKMQRKIAMMDKQIQSLLTLSANGLDRSNKLPLRAIAQDILLELSITGRKVKCELEIPDGLMLTGAESEIRSILHAVLVNACEASREGEQEIRLRLHGETDKQGIALEITDWGTGLSDEQKQHLGEPHFTTKAEGTGMGLYIAKRLLSAHYHGDIQFKDNPQGGTVVLLRFREA